MPRPSAPNPGKGAAPGLKAHAGQHRQAAVLLAGQQGGFQLIQVGEGLQQHQIGPGGLPRPHDPGKGVHRFLKGEGAGRFQQLPQRAYVQGHQGAMGRGGLPGALDARLNRLLHRIAAARQFVGRRTKGVGAEDTAARLRIRTMDGLDQGRVLDVQRLGLGPQGQARRLQHGAHGSVQQDGLMGAQDLSSFHSSRLSFGIRICPAAHSGRSRPSARTPAHGRPPAQPSRSCGAASETYR